MTDNNDKNQPNHDDDSSLPTTSDENKASYDLRAIAEEAIRLLNNNQSTQSSTVSSDAVANDVDPLADTQPDTKQQTPAVEANRPELESIETSDDDSNFGTAPVDVDAHVVSQNPPEKATNPVNETSHPNSAEEEENGNTTNDLVKEAMKARAIEEQRKREAVQKAQSVVTELSLFSSDMRLKLESGESTDVIIKEVNDELIVGRADNVTDYVPEIDLTPHGAYRLGLSRRHAVILRENDRVLVRDLNSRNGTFVNGAIVPGGGTMVIRDGDEIRFGNLAMKASFISE